MRLADYLVFRTPPAHLGVQNAPAPGIIPASRVALSLIGLIIGTAASFVVTGIHPGTTTVADHHKNPVSSVGAASPSRNTPETTPSTDAPAEPKVNLDLSGHRILNRWPNLTCDLRFNPFLGNYEMPYTGPNKEMFLSIE